VLFRLALVLVLVATSIPAFAGRRAQLACKRSCGPLIDQCVEGGGRRRKCKRQVLRRCRRDGVGVCIPPGTHHVAPSGSDLAGCGGVDAPCRTMQFVLDELVPPGGAGTIKVAAGTYSDLARCVVGTVPNQAVVCILDQQIVLLGGFVPPNWDTPAEPSATIIDPMGQGRGVRVVRSRQNGTAASLEMAGFTIQNALVAGASSGTIDETWVSGGGMLVENGTVSLRDVVFRNNEARGGSTGQRAGGRGAGGGLAMYDVWPSVPASATLQRVTFDGNRAVGGGGDDAGGYALGGGAFTYGMPVSGDGLVFTGNSATGGSTSGAGANGADKGDALGGAFTLEQDGVADLHHVDASGNVATGGTAPNGEAGGAFGGAFFAEMGSLTITDGVVQQNGVRGGNGKNTTTAAAIAQGGGVYATMGALTLDRVRVVGNDARAGDGSVNGGIAEGGGVAVTLGARDGHDTPFTIRNAVIADNSLSLGAGVSMGGGGAGLFVQGAAGTVEHATIADNRTPDPLLGIAVSLFYIANWPAQVTIRNTIIANHTPAGSSPSCYTALWAAQNTTADVAGILFAHNVHDTNADTAGGCNVPSGVFAMSGVLTAGAPGFVSPGAPDDDYHLTARSPAIDQASVGAVTVDLDGQPRPVGAAPDLGAYELVP